MLASGAKPVVIAPSKKEPGAALLLSPPAPSVMPPSWCIGMYAAGSDPFQSWVSVAALALPPLRANWLWPSLRRTAVTNGEVWLTLAGLLDPLLVKTPFSRSAWIQGPLPEHGGAPQKVDMMSASMWP